MRRMETSGRFAIFEDDSVTPHMYRVYEDDKDVAAFSSYHEARDYVSRRTEDHMPQGEPPEV